MPNPYAYNPLTGYYTNYYPQAMTSPQAVGYIPVPNTQQTTPSSASPVNVVWITNESEKDIYPVAPNSAVLLWDDANKKIYLKKADSTGKPIIETYSISKDISVAKEQATTTQYVTEDSLSKAINKSLSPFKKELEEMRKDIYGIMGKKKVAKDDNEEDR